ncbi:hypothetical protein [Enterococcus cecorum]|uniref:hypothetical protein n=1 Tax=Enterococcus cecorum TaxID=44008 RepID=UPI002ACAA578|nr:hypothetical protein [Enterococcus cecorum]MDZ5583859.1 hypothetical protein [Enterococcus cecorum]
MARLTDQEKQKIESLRKENGIKNMYYTRYFLIRYVVAFFFFANLYWILMIFLSKPTVFVIIPSLLAGLGAICMWEQSRMYAKDQKPAVKTHFYFVTIIVVNSLLLIATLLDQFQYFYPFLAVNATSKTLLMGILFTGDVIAAWMLVKLHRINQKKDKQYDRIKRYLQSINQ